MVSLRSIEPTDVDLLLGWESDRNLWRVSGGNAPLSRFILWRYLENYNADIFQSREVRMIIEADGQPVGTADITDFDPINLRAQVGMMVIPDQRGKGIATEALELLKDYAFATLYINQIYAVIDNGNTSSLAMLSKAGFICTATLKQWLRNDEAFTDAVVMQAFAKDWKQRIK